MRIADLMQYGQMVLSGPFQVRSFSSPHTDSVKANLD